MKFFTKKTKIVFLVIILIGAILLAYNSLSYHLDYQTLKDLNYFSLKRFGVIISSHKLNPFSVFIKSKRLRGVIIDAIKFKNYEVVKEFFRNK